MFRHFNRITLPVSKQAIFIKELSFTEYKFLCKSFFTENTIEDISKIFDDILQRCCDTEIASFVDKVYALIKIRELTLGRNITLIVNDVNYNIQTDLLTAQFKDITEKVEVELSDRIKCVFVQNKSMISAISHDTIVDTFLRNVIIDNNSYNVNELSSKERDTLYNILPAISKDVLEELKKTFNFVLSFKLNDKYNISSLDDGFISFLKLIYTGSYPSLLDFEYKLRTTINLTQPDFDVIPYPECHVLYDKYVDEHKEKQ